MRGLVIGGGSIGTRHIENLKSLGVDNLVLVEPDWQRRNTVAYKYDVQSYRNLLRVPDVGFDFAIIASPTHLHAQHALQVILDSQGDTHLFIEKPLSHNRFDLKLLEELTKQHDLVSMVGCNMRFHPGPKAIKELLDLDTQPLGRLMFARIHAGSYLPDWHPEEDYTQSYSANKSMGGGCILDCIHEIDLAMWLMGDIDEVFCLSGKLSDLEIDVEDIADLTCKHNNDAVSTIHLDFAQRTYERGIQVAGTNGSVFWDYNTARLRYYRDGAERGGAFPPYDTNTMYLESMSHFLDCVKSGEQTVNPVSQAIKTMDVVWAAKKSGTTGRMEIV